MVALYARHEVSYQLDRTEEYIIDVMDGHSLGLIPSTGTSQRLEMKRWGCPHGTSTSCNGDQRNKSLKSSHRAANIAGSSRW